MQIKNWRKESGLICTPEYRKRFALLPIQCEDGTTIFLGSYYKKFNVWTYDSGSVHRHTDKEDDIPRYKNVEFVENVTEEVYMIRKLSENL